VQTPAGEWRGLEVAIKTIVFQCHAAGDEIGTVASEAAISSNLSHRNIAATYAHDIVKLGRANGNEHAVYKFFLIQARACGGRADLFDACSEASDVHLKMGTSWQGSQIRLCVALTKPERRSAGVLQRRHAAGCSRARRVHGAADAAAVEPHHERARAHRGGHATHAWQAHLPRRSQPRERAAQGARTLHASALQVPFQHNFASQPADSALEHSLVHLIVTSLCSASMLWRASNQ
jgi:hypothetical protein